MSLVAQTLYVVDLNDGLRNNMVCALKNPEVEPYFLCKQTMYCIEEPELTWRFCGFAFFE